MAKHERRSGQWPVSKQVHSLSERRQQVAKRAFELYASRDYRSGYDLDDWLEAEREIDRAE